jgi:peptide/nickel transport system ATP-binding protein
LTLPAPIDCSRKAAILSVRELTTDFFVRNGSVRAVDGVSFDLRRGEVLGLVGESGSGKSATGLSLMGLIDPPGRVTAGQADFDGRDLFQLDAESFRQLRGRRISMVFQDPTMTLNPTLRIETQMVEAILAHEDVPAAEARRRSIEALAKVGIPSPAERLSAYPHQFSGGMRQRVAIAIAFLNDPDIIIADEPTTALDVTIQAQILHGVRRICRERGTALIWITHDLSILAQLADRIAVMYAGRIVEQGSVDQVLGWPQHPYTRGLLASVPSRNARGARMREIGGGPPSLAHPVEGCAFRPRCPRAEGLCREAPALRPTAIGGEARCHFPLGAPAAEGLEVVAASAVSARDSTPPALELSNLSKTFSAKLDPLLKLMRQLGVRVRHDFVRAVDDVSITIQRGEVVGLVGESGCGKSTVARMAAGILQPDAGAVAVHRSEGRGVSSDAGLTVQMVFQDPMSSLNPRLRVGRLIGEAPRRHRIVTAREADGYVDGLLRRVGLDPAARDRHPHQFSGGQRQRIAIARALAVKPDILICDEAVSALDVSIQAQILNLFMDLRREFDLSILFISHDLGVIRHISDRIVVMYLGRVVEAAPAEELFADPNHPYAQALIEGMPSFERRRTPQEPPKGELPSPLNPPPGCHFHPRCPFAFDRCRTERPPLKSIAASRLSACHLNDVPRAPAPGKPLAQPERANETIH